MNALQTALPDFNQQLIAALPRLRSSARGMTRDRDRADDLAQDTAVKALVGRNSFRTGTNFSAWVSRIQRNTFISDLRRVKPMVPIDPDGANLPSHRPRQEDGLVMREFLGAFAKLHANRRSALLLAAVDEQPYAMIAKRAGISVGTVKSRVSRGRAALKRLLSSDEQTVTA